MQPNGIYIYAIVHNFYSSEMFRLLEKYGVYAIPFQNISAIVSNRENAHIDFADRETLGHLLVHHQKTIEGLVSVGFNMLNPMQLGTIAKSKHEVLRILASGYNLIINTLNKIEHLTEIDLAVTWADLPDILQEIVNHPEISALKKSMLSNSNGISQDDQVKIGMLIQEKLKEKNTKVELDIREAMSSVSQDIKTHEVMDDQMICNSAFLINRNNKEKFEAIIYQLDEKYNDKLNFKMVGSLPCYSFYTMEVKEVSLEEVALAKKELGLGRETSDSEIKRAYQDKVKEFHPDVSRGNENKDNFNRIKKAYHTLIEYSEATNQAMSEQVDMLVKENETENIIVVKIKE
jgi:hypothetical protein